MKKSFFFFFKREWKSLIKGVPRMFRGISKCSSNCWEFAHYACKSRQRPETVLPCLTLLHLLVGSWWCSVAFSEGMYPVSCRKCTVSDWNFIILKVLQQISALQTYPMHLRLHAILFLPCLSTLPPLLAMTHTLSLCEFLHIQGLSKHCRPNVISRPCAWRLCLPSPPLRPPLFSWLTFFTQSSPTELISCWK